MKFLFNFLLLATIVLLLASVASGSCRNSRKDREIILKILLSGCKDSSSSSSSSSSSCEECPDSCELSTEKPPCDPYGCICTEEYDPVCGSDGITYSNMCRFNCAANCDPSLVVEPCEDTTTTTTTVAPCDPNGCVCSKELRPVCDTNGNTYSNQCYFECALKCNPNLVQKSCCDPNNYDPVCDQRGNHYTNRCYLQEANNFDPSLAEYPCPKTTTSSPTTIETIIFTATPCNPNGCICTLDWRPICGSDGKTYGNMCGFNCALRCYPMLSVVNNGSCVTTPISTDTTPTPVTPCNPNGCPCPQDLRPVCGSDGTTYGNMCAFNCAQTCYPTLSVVNQGICPRTIVTNSEHSTSTPVTPVTPCNPTGCSCNRKWDPVCGSDGKTYGNMCTFDCAKNCNTSLFVVNPGSCKSTSTGPAPTSSTPFGPLPTEPAPKPVPNQRPPMVRGV